MKKIATAQYTGKLKVNCVHLDSGSKIITDAPKDNEGEGKTFSPTDLLCTSLASCILTVMGISAKKHDIDMSGAMISISKEMANNPRRVSKIALSIDMSSQSYSDKEKKILKAAAEGCPVELSLHEDMDLHMDWTWAS